MVTVVGVGTNDRTAAMHLIYRTGSATPGRPIAWAGNKEAGEGRMTIDQFAPQVSFFFYTHNDFFEEVAKYRAGRRRWAHIVRERYGAQKLPLWNTEQGWIDTNLPVDVLPEARALIPRVGRLPGIDGKAKMSKSLGNTINLGATAAEIKAAVKNVYTDPLHLRVEDPGHLEGNVAFIYLDAFDTDKIALQEMKDHYVRGGLGDSKVKARLEGILQDMLAPIRARREEFAKDRGQVLQILKQGTERAREVAARTTDEVKAAIGLKHF